MTGSIAGIRNKITSFLGQKYLERKARKGQLDISMVTKLPDSATFCLRRDFLDPIPELMELQQSEPIAKLDLPFGKNVWLVTGHQEMKEILADPKRYSNDFGNLVGTAGATEEDNPGGLGFADPPIHTRYRKILMPEFTVRRLARLEPMLTRIINERLDAMEASQQPVDLVQDFGLAIPSLAICELLGVSYEDRADFQRLAVDRFNLYGGANASFGALNESMEYLSSVIAKERANPGDGLLGRIIKNNDDLTDRQLIGLADGLLTGGFETTASMISLGAILLLTDSEALTQVKDGDADAVHRFTEEVLRYLTVVQMAFPRFAKERVTVGGVTFEPGDVVLCQLAAGSRDPRLGEDMDKVCPMRKPVSHMAFGHGIHRCVGAELGRLELRLAYPALVRRFPKLRLAVKPEELTFRKLSIVYAVDKLPVYLN